jgi:hypothetical protein
MADGETVTDVDWESKGGHYRVRVPKTAALSYDPETKTYSSDPDKVWVDVPDDAVITEPNLFGRTMVWPTWSGPAPAPDIAIRCFLRGSMT